MLSSFPDLCPLAASSTPILVVRTRNISNSVSRPLKGRISLGWKPLRLFEQDSHMSNKIKAWCIKRIILGSSCLGSNLKYYFTNTWIPTLGKALHQSWGKQAKTCKMSMLWSSEPLAAQLEPGAQRRGGSTGGLMLLLECSCSGAWLSPVRAGVYGMIGGGRQAGHRDTFKKTWIGSHRI